MDDHISLHEASRQLGISVRTARRWIKAGTLPATLRPGRYGLAYIVPIAAVTHLREEHGLGRSVAEPSLRDLAAAIEGLRVEVQRLREDVARLRDAPS